MNTVLQFISKENSKENSNEKNKEESFVDDFEQVFIEQFPLVYNYIFYNVGNATEAEDLTADIFVRAFEYWKSFSASKGSRGAWIGGIARNMLKDYYQKKANRPQTVELSEFTSSSTDIEDDFLLKENLRQIFDQIDALPEIKRDLITMKYLLRLNNREIAKIMDMTESNVGVTLHRTIKDMQKKLRKVL